MAWKAALTRDSLILLRGDDGLGNGELADSLFFQEQENEREAAEDDVKEDEESKSKQNTFRGEILDEDGQRLVLEDDDVPPIIYGRRRIESRERCAPPRGVADESGLVRAISRGSRIQTAKSKGSVDGSMLHEVERISTGLQKATRLSTGNGSVFRPGNGSASKPGTRHGRRTARTASRHEDLGFVQYGTGQDIVLFMKPSLPGVGHTEYSDWASPDCTPYLPRNNVQDYLAGEDNLPTHYVEDEYYEGASIRAKDYWSLKRLGRQLLGGVLPPGHPMYQNRVENLHKIELLIPSRQVKYDAGGRISMALRLYVWRTKRRKAAVMIQATYRMHLTKFLKRKLRAEKKQRMMEEDFRAVQAQEREEKKQAEEKARQEEAKKIRKAEVAQQQKASQNEADAEEAHLLSEIETLGARAAMEVDGREGKNDDDMVLTDSTEDADIREQLAVLKESGMKKAERLQMIVLLRKARDPSVKLSDMERSKLEMVGQMREAERKRKEFCAALVQAFWRGKCQRREMDRLRDVQRKKAKRARDDAMSTVVSRVYRGHIARRILKYTRAHKARQVRLNDVVASEGFTRGAVQRRMESRKKQLDISVCDVQRVYRGHLGRRRQRAQETLKWELKVDQAACTIQRMYRDSLDRQWSMYMRRGNLQILVGQKIATRARRGRDTSPDAALNKLGLSTTVKPPTRKNYPTNFLKTVSNLVDGVPWRALSPAKERVAPPAPSMPRAVTIRKRWGLPYTVAAYDETTRQMVMVADRLKLVQHERAGMTTEKATDTNFDSFSDAGSTRVGQTDHEDVGWHSPAGSERDGDESPAGATRPDSLQGIFGGASGREGDLGPSMRGTGLRQSDGNGRAGTELGSSGVGAERTLSSGSAGMGSLSGVSGAQKSSSTGRRVVFPGEGPSFPQRTLDPSIAESQFGDNMRRGVLIGGFTKGGGWEGVLEEEMGRHGGETPPDFFGTAEDVHRRGMAGQIMPDYLRKQWREEQARRGERQLHTWGALPAVFLKARQKPGKGESLFDLARKRDEQYSGLKTSEKISLAINRLDSSGESEESNDGGLCEAATAAEQGVTVPVARVAKRFGKLALTALMPKDDLYSLDLKKKFGLSYTLQGSAALSLARRMPASHWQERAIRLSTSAAHKYNRGSNS